MSFVHLHVHSEYSFLDSLLKVDDIVQFAANHSNVACISDHGNMSAYVELAKTCKKYNCKPIYSCEIYETDDEFALDNNGKRLPHYHLLLIAKNKTGLENLFHIVSYAETEGFYRKPRISVDRIKENNWGKGIICLTACQAGRLSRLLTSYEIDKAKEWIEKLQSIFDFVVCEWQSHNTPSQFEANSRILEFAKNNKLPHVITCDAHYLKENDIDAHAIYVRISEDRDVSELYSGCWLQEEPDIYRTLFEFNEEDIRHGINMSQTIADMIDDSIDIGLDAGLQMPAVPIPQEFKNEDDYLRYLVYSHFDEKFGYMSEEEQQKRRDRIEEELPVIFFQHYSPYFIMNMRFLQRIREAGIPTGFGRGSAGNCLCLYMLGVTQVDSVRWGLDFSRFSNYGRVSPPDVDTDISKRQRRKVIEIAIDMFGKENVAPIAAFSTMSTKVTLRDVGKALNDDPNSPYYDRIPYSIRSDVMNCIPTIKTLDDLGDSVEKEALLKDLINSNVKLQKAYEEFPLWFEYAMKIEGRIRGRSKHASGVLVSPKPLIKYGPLCLDRDKQVQFSLEMHSAQDDLGLLKLDVLGLRNLDIIEDTLQNAGLSWQDIDINHLNLADEDVFKKVYASGNTVGIFQMESGEARQMCIDADTSDINDVVAIGASNRPGTKAQFPSYCENKIHPENATVVHPDLRQIFGETYYVMLYQEQALQIFRYAGFEEREVDNARRAIGKKKADVMASLEAQFRQGLKNKMWSEDQIQWMWDLILLQSSYSFNKGHSVAYGLLSYLTAWLKTHYPIEFMSACMTADSGDVTKLAILINDCKRMGIEVLPPNINKSNLTFTPMTDKNSILFGLLAIKGLGETTIQDILCHRPFKSFNDFLSKIKDKTATINLIKSGAFSVDKKLDLMKLYAKHLIEKKEYKEVKTVPSKVKLLMEWGINSDDYKDGKRINKEALLEDYNTAKRIRFEREEHERYNTAMREFQQKYALDEWLWEFESLSMFITSDPLQFAYRYIRDFKQIETDTECVLIGMIVGIDRKKDRRGGLFCYINLYTPDGFREVICWATAYKNYMDLIKKGNCIAVYGRKTDGGNLVVNEMKDYKDWLNDRGIAHKGVNS